MIIDLSQAHTDICLDRYVEVHDGQCYLGMANVIMIPLLVFDLVVNGVWCVQFLLPIYWTARARRQSSDRSPIFNEKLRSLALRTTWATLGTCAATLSNLVQIALSRTEKAWILWLTFSLEVVFSCVVVRTLGHILATTANDWKLHFATQPSKPVRDSTGRNLQISEPNKSLSVSLEFVNSDVVSDVV